jgi:putative endonuclease
MGAFVYMLRCSDDSFYIGSATGDDLTRRIAEHQTRAYPGYTYTRRPVRLVWSEHFDRITDAIAVERQIKGWSRAKKEALIKGDWAAIQQLSKRRGGRPLPAASTSETSNPSSEAAAHAGSRHDRGRRPSRLPGRRGRGAPQGDGTKCVRRGDQPHFTLLRASTLRTASTSSLSLTANCASACFFR